MTNDKYKLLLYWIRERYTIHRKRLERYPPPWTKDPILQSYRFCNVHRENDKVTQWIALHWRHPHADDPDLWFAMLVARYINEPATMELMGYPIPWNPKRFLAAVQIQKDRKLNVFNAAYIISTGGLTIPKHEYLTQFFTRVWTDRKELRPQKGTTLAEYCQTLVAQPGIGRFMAGQIIADLKYVPSLQKAADWWSFAISGPGSRRGMNRLLDRPVKQGWKEDEWFAWLCKVRDRVNTDVKHWKVPMLHGQDMQNCLCEFDKYCRVLNGEGKPKQKFIPVPV